MKSQHTLMKHGLDNNGGRNRKTASNSFRLYVHIWSLISFLRYFS